jgi:hypothetical protein
MTNAEWRGKRSLQLISALARGFLFLQLPPLLGHGAVAKW